MYLVFMNSRSRDFCLSQPIPGVAFGWVGDSSYPWGRDVSTPPKFRFATLRLRSTWHCSTLLCATEDGSHYFHRSYVPN